MLFLLAAIHFVRLFPYFSTRILGDVMDTAEYPLNEWWTAYALLDLKTNPFQNSYQFHPLGLNMVHHTYNFLDGLLYTLFRPVVPLLVFHNALTWATLFVNALAAYVLLFSLTRLPGLAFVGALAFAHSPVLTSYIGVSSLIEPYLFVFFVLTAYRLFQTGNYRWAVGSGIILGLSVYNYPYYFVAGLVWFGVLVTCRFFPWTIKAEPDRQGGKSFRPGLVFVGVGLGLTFILVLIPKELWESIGIGKLLRTESFLFFLLLVYFIRKILAPEIAPGPTGDKRRLMQWLLPSRFRWAPPSRQETVVILKLSALLLLTMALVAFPYTRSFVADEATRSAVKSVSDDFVRYGVDLTGFVAPFHPWLAQVSQKVALNWNNGWPIVGTPAFLGYFWIFLVLIGVSRYFKKPELRPWIVGWTAYFLLCLGPYLQIHGMVYTSFILPAYYSSKLPLLESARTSSRFLVPLMLFSITIGCLLLKEVFQKSSRVRRAFLYSGLVLLVGFEFALWPVPEQIMKTDYQAPAVYQALAEKSQGKAGVLLDLPLFSHSGTYSRGNGETRAIFYQTVHRQRLIGGVSSKLDDRVFAYFEKFPGVKSFWEMNPVSPEELAAALAALEVDWIVLYKSRVPADPLNAYLSTFREAPYLQVFYEDGSYVGLRVDRQDRTLQERASAYRNRPGT